MKVKTKSNGFIVSSKTIEPAENDNVSSEEDGDVETKSIPKGKPKSGRFWKSEKNRTRSLVKTKGLQFSLEKKIKLKNDLLRIKNLSREIISNKNKEKEERRLRRKDNIKKRSENEKKAEVVQVITNSSKLRKLKKKHIRSIQKRDTHSLLK